MTDVLAEIVNYKRQEVAAAKIARPLEILRAAIDMASPVRDFYAAATRPTGALRVIAEVKRASPSAGLIRPDFDPTAIAKAYHRAGAAAISCLTDEKFFQGSLRYLEEVRRAVPLPVLRKDFIIDVYQLFEARVAGADAVLLIAECLDDATLESLMTTAGALNMTVLLEIHDAENLDRAQAIIARMPRTATLLGINNRDLKAMKTDLDHTLRLLPRVRRPHTLVSESGIRTPDDIRRLRDAGVHRVLVGEHLMRQPDVEAALRTLMTTA